MARRSFPGFIGVEKRYRVIFGERKKVYRVKLRRVYCACLCGIPDGVQGKSMSDYLVRINRVEFLHPLLASSHNEVTYRICFGLAEVVHVGDIVGEAGAPKVARLNSVIPC